MKKILLVLSFCSIIPLMDLTANPLEIKSSNPIFLNLLENEGINSYHVSAFLVKLVISFSDKAEVINPLFSGVRFINIAACDNDGKDYNETYQRICKGLDRSSYYNLIDIVGSGSKITIKALLKNNLIRELVILVREGDNFIAISMTGKIDPHGIADAIAKLNRSETL